ncbi:Putative sucrose phosphorylase [Halomicronema hongdechloris C2206]|uniref:Sucrose phosphorylase n=1 Tax=Halomicronema hongdechloris C2206 TaxID=1641165 RepID=A0A1Z3HNJ5_9CYAN|nr:alpha-amylase family glycosyl hydrolase [Halomicronema hongdechloris]ASC71883.1 Putative sucrose phosphorylase [Halomicronema hongdechloris C2206]
MIAVPKQQVTQLSSYIEPLLKRIYPEPVIPGLLDKILHLIEPYLTSAAEENLKKWNHDNVLLITYGDSIASSDGRSPLTALGDFLDTYLKDTITGVHILPFFPYSSDDGFAITDYQQVNPVLGDWEDIRHIAHHFNLMVDLVVNHVSSQHSWFQQFKQGQKPGCDYFITVDPDTDLSQVVRPRSLPLLTPVDTKKGRQYVWSTFSNDQIDVNFANPDVLWEYLKIILFYVQNGARYLRLDAVGFLWKKIGTKCIHLSETHNIIRLFREILQLIDPGIALITETNVPNRENLSYFGNRNEAHMIYNFSLPPLLLHALIQGKSDHLKTWMMSMPPAPIGCAYFNFTASHDGIGLRPAEGLLSQDEYDTLLETMRQCGGDISMRRHPDGSESPYEINISLFDALKGTVDGPDQWQIERFLCAQTIMMSLEGIPAFYIHSLLATHNDTARRQETGQKRSINRHKWDYDALKAALADSDSSHAIVFEELCRLIQIRRRQRAFHPNATQYTLHPLNKALLAFWRQSMARDQSIFSVHNLSNQPQELRLADLNLLNTDTWYDLISGDQFQDIYSAYTLQPYQSLWITNKIDSAHDSSIPDPLLM